MDFSNIPIPSMTGEEVVVGRHESGIDLQEGMNTSVKRFYCTSCRADTHCFVTVDKETKKAEIHISCTNSNCQCKCKTHYACRNCGYLHPYGQNCDFKEHYIEQKIDPFIEDLNKKFRELQESKLIKIKDD